MKLADAIASDLPLELEIQGFNSAASRLAVGAARRRHRLLLSRLGLVTVRPIAHASRNGRGRGTVAAARPRSRERGRFAGASNDTPGVSTPVRA